MVQITKTILSDGTVLTDVALSEEPMGKGNFQIEFPSNLDEGKSETIRLIIAPPLIEINRNGSKNSNFEILQDTLDVYPVMHAELTANDTFSIKTIHEAEKPIVSNSSTQWEWIITPLKSGEQIVFLVISVPVVTNGQNTPYQLASIELRINVKALPTPTPPPAPTSTPIPSVKNQLNASASQITIAVIGAATTIIVAILGIWFNKSNKDKAIEEKKRKEYEADKSERVSKTKRGLDWRKKK